MKFIGRKDFLNKLKKQVDTDEMSFSLIYGRRRVGKSELVKETLRCANEKSIYFECKQVAEESNVASLSAIVSDVMGLPKLGYTDIESLLDYIFKLAVNEKLILVLDEYPYLRESVKGLDSILQSLVDRYRESSKLKVIILGSYVEIMRSLLEHSNPLYGRVDLTIDLKQMDYYESALFYPEFSPEDKVRIYSVFGGIPYYNRLIDDGMLFLMIMIPTRAFVGGYHAKTHLRCNISFICTYLFSLLLLKIIGVQYKMIVQIFVIAGFIIISAGAPLENRNKKLSDIQKSLYNKISQAIYILLMVIGIIVNYKDQELSLYINIILIIIVALLIIGKEGRNEIEEKALH